MFIFLKLRLEAFYTQVCLSCLSVLSCPFYIPRNLSLYIPRNLSLYIPRNMCLGTSPGTCLGTAPGTHVWVHPPEHDSVIPRNLSVQSCIQLEIVHLYTCTQSNRFGDYCLHSGTFYDRVVLVSLSPHILLHISFSKLIFCLSSRPESL